jgi:hypothetical protein
MYGGREWWSGGVTLSAWRAAILSPDPSKTMPARVNFITSKEKEGRVSTSGVTRWYSKRARGRTTVNLRPTWIVTTTTTMMMIVTLRQMVFLLAML